MRLHRGRGRGEGIRSSCRSSRTRLGQPSTPHNPITALPREGAPKFGGGPTGADSSLGWCGRCGRCAEGTRARACAHRGTRQRGPSLPPPPPLPSLQSLPRVLRTGPLHRPNAPAGVCAHVCARPERLQGCGDIYPAAGDVETSAENRLNIHSEVPESLYMVLAVIVHAPMQKVVVRLWLARPAALVVTRVFDGVRQRAAALVVCATGRQRATATPAGAPNHRPPPAAHACQRSRSSGTGVGKLPVWGGPS